MVADFYIRRNLYSVVSAIALSIVLYFMCYAGYIAHVHTVWLGKTLYFLVSNEPNEEVAAYTARLDGGAGYLLVDNSANYVAYSVYLNDIDAKIVQTDVEGLILPKAVGSLTFKGREKERADIYCGALNSLYGCIEVLSQSVDMLESGATQQTCKRVLRILENQFAHLSLSYQVNYPDFADVCADVQGMLYTILQDTIFCKDLRYILCDVCDSYVQLAAKFSV